MSTPYIQIPPAFADRVLGIIRPFHDNPNIQLYQIPTEEWTQCIFDNFFVFPHSFGLEENISGNELHLLATHNVRQIFTCGIDLYAHLGKDPLPTGPQLVMSGKFKGQPLSQHRFARTTIFEKENPEEIGFFAIRKHTGDFPEDRFGCGNPYAFIVW